MFRDVHVSPVRCVLAAFLIFVHFAVIAVGLTGVWQRPFLALRVPAMAQPFGDFRVIPAAVESAAQGHDPLVSNPADPRARPLNYPRAWLLVGRAFPGETGALAAGLLFAGLFSLAAAFLVATQKTTAASIASVLLALSSSVWLGLERANTDLVIFALLTLALCMSWRYRAVLIGLATVLKVYPVVACAAKAVRERTAFNIGIAAASIAYLAAIYGDLVRISQTTEVSGFLSFGLKSAVILFTSGSLPVMPVYIAFVIGTLVAAGLAFYVRFSDTPSPFERETMFVTGALLIFCYLAATNWDYRLVFFLLTIPYLLRPGVKAWEQVLGWIAAGLMVVAANFGVLYPAYGDTGIFVNLAAKYLLYCILVFSVARILIHSDDVRSFFRRASREQEISA